MKIGLLSDTHGNLPATRLAAHLLTNAGALAIFHCGDIGGESVLAELSAICSPKHVPVFAVLGNVDHPASDWCFFPTSSGVEILGRFGEQEVDGKKVAWLHGDDSSRLQKILSDQIYDFVFSGHTHCFHDQQIGKTRWLNPGSAGRGTLKSCLLLDLKTNLLEQIILPAPESRGKI